MGQPDTPPCPIEFTCVFNRGRLSLSKVSIIPSGMRTVEPDKGQEGSGNVERGREGLLYSSGGNRYAQRPERERVRSFPLACVGGEEVEWRGGRERQQHVGFSKSTQAWSSSQRGHLLLPSKERGPLLLLSTAQASQDVARSMQEMEGSAHFCRALLGQDLFERLPGCSCRCRSRCMPARCRRPGSRRMLAPPIAPAPGAPSPPQAVSSARARRRALTHYVHAYTLLLQWYSKP